MKKYAIIGAGSRGIWHYARAILRDYGDCATLAALVDVNPLRLKAAAESLSQPVAAYTDFDEMVAREAPDCAIITTTDCFHDEYVQRALDKGLEVLCDKPMAIDAQKCANILEAERRNGRKIDVTFNIRYQPHVEQMKRIVLSGALGEILNVDFEWMLDRVHGASYFRRWHRYLDKSGGILLTKATHHFDLANFLIGQAPVSVYAAGDLKFYGKNRRSHAYKCADCPSRARCEFAYDYKGVDELSQKMFFDAGAHDGYTPDMCPFDESIDIYDTANLTVKYDGGAQMSYSLCAYAPYEGWKIAITGAKGRMESSEYHSGPDHHDPVFRTVVYPAQGDKQIFETRAASGAHGGADSKILDRLLRGLPEDPLGQRAGSFDGVMSCMIGICANESIKTGKPVRVNELLDTKKYFGR